jgi:hypothetical protein
MLPRKLFVVTGLQICPFLACDNANGSQPDRSMHGQPSLLQMFFTSKLFDMKAFIGIFHLPPGRADIINRARLDCCGKRENHDAGISVVRALGTFRRF